MPQLDYNTFFSNYFWTTVFFTLIYIFTLILLLPKIFKIIFFNLLFKKNMDVLEQYANLIKKNSLKIHLFFLRLSINTSKKILKCYY